MFKALVEKKKNRNHVIVENINKPNIEYKQRSIFDALQCLDVVLMCNNLELVITAN